jgi:hypothetical protein
MPSIASVRFDVASWYIKEQSDQKIVWFNRVPDMLLLEFAPHALDLPADLQDMAGMRAFIERMVRQNAGAVISVENVTCDELEGVKSIFKYRQTPSSRRSPLGMAYLGLYIFPLAAMHYLLKVQCCEYGTTGLREAAVALLQPRPAPGEYKKVSSMQELLSNLSQSEVRLTPADDEQYDTSFPNHPLSRLRGYLKHIEETFIVDENVKIAEPFRRD